MKLPRRNFLHLAAGVAGLPVVSRVAWAQAYPTRPVRIIAPTGPGGAPDIIARLIGPWLSQRLGQQFVVENRPGSGSNIGTEAVVRAAPDGYTLLIASSANTINATLYDKLNFVFLRDIAPVAGISRETGAMVVNPSFPAKTVPEFIAYAKAKVGGHRCLHPRSRRAVQDDDRGRHGSCALSWWRARAHRFARRTGAGLLPHHCLIDRVYQGWQAACARSNHRDALGRAARHPDRGRVRAGLRGELLVWRRRSQEHTRRDLNKLNEAINAGLADPTIKARLADLGGVPMPMWPAEFGKFIAEETEKWGNVIRALNIKAD
jgi:tripartite-type tricarboxylate transporter receptor subunit TctC